MNIYLLFLALASTERPLAIVGSETLSCQEFRIQIATQGICDLSTENIEPLLQNWADGLLLCHEAARLGLDQNETTQATLRNYERQYVIGMLTARLTDTVQVTANDIFDYFNRRRLDFATRLRFAYMVLPDEQTARQTIKELNSGKDFRQLAQERSLARTAVPLAETVLTGRLDTTVSLDPLLEDTIFSLPKGKVSPPIKVSTAWWLVKPLETSYLTDTVTLEQVRPFVTRLLELKRKRAIIENATTLLRRKARVRLPAKGDTSGLLAEVNGQRLTRRELNTWLENPELLRESELAQAAETWIRSELLYQEARRLGLGNDDSTRIVLLTRQRDHIADLMIERILEDVRVTNNEVFDYYQSHKEDFLHNVRIKYILLGSESLARLTYQELQKGADFARLARERSYDRATSQGQDSRYLDRLESQLWLSPSLEEAIFRLAPQAISEPIRTKEGYWIIQVTDRKKVRNDLPFEAARDKILVFLQRFKAEQRLNAELVRLRKLENVQLFPQNYW